MTRTTLIALSTFVAAGLASPLAQSSSSPRPAAAAAPAPSGVRTITITGLDSPTVHWDVTKITAKPGESLHIVLKATGMMPKMAMAHNFVLLKSGLTQKQVDDFVMGAAMATQTANIPAAKKDMVLAHTPKVIGAGETTEVTFKAPTAPGTYPFLCSFPGHYAMGMKGTLVVAP
jgi:azurin